MSIVIDVSKHNGKLDWAKFKSAGVTHAILKASEGVGVKDKQFSNNAKGCIDNGILWGAYHFATWNKKPVDRDAKEEAEWFLKVVGDVEVPLPLVLDIESNKPIPYSKKEMETYVSTFINHLKSKWIDIAIYGSPGFLNSYLSPNHPFKNIKLWVADYTGAINPIVGSWKPWLHQYTDKGVIPGFKGNFDLNKFV